MAKMVKIFDTIKDIQSYIMEQEDEVLFCQEDNSYYITKESGIEKVEIQFETPEGEGSEIKIDLYEINRQIFSQLNDYSEKDIALAKERIAEWVNPNCNYYLLYGKEVGYFTLFVKDSNTDEQIVDLIIECLSVIGPIKDISVLDNGAIEIWINFYDNITCMYLFDYEQGVVKFNG